MTAATLDGAGLGEIDWSAELGGDDAATATPGPLTGSRGTRSGTRKPRKPAAKKLEALQTKLSSEMFQAGIMVGVGLPTTGYYVCQESDAFTQAVIELASTRPEWVDALENIAKIQPGIVIGKTALGIGAAIGVDRGRVDPEKRMMKFLGVYSAYQAIQNKREAAEGSAYSEPPAGAFVPVS